MRPFRLNSGTWLILVFLGAVLAYADQTSGIFGVYNEAVLGSNYTIARGSNLLIFSGDLPIGPVTPARAEGYPLVTSLAGTTVRVIAGDTTVDAYVLGTETNWVRALLPSGTPLGDGFVVVTYNGRSSAPYLIRIVERQLGLYDGTWCGPSAFSKAPSFCVPRTVRNAGVAVDAPANTLVAPARPGQLVTIRGTGLGAAPGDEAASPIPGNLEIPGLEIIVGNQTAKIVYAGRSDCCAGMDDIVFEVPAGIEGCNVPVWVRYNGAATGDVLVSIASGTGACSDPQALSETEVRRLHEGKLKAATLSISQGYWSAAFGIAIDTPATPFGTCRAYSWGGAFAVDFDNYALQDAGRVLNLRTPGQNVTASRGDSGYYNGPFGGEPESGTYTLDNGSGGSGVGSFRLQFSLIPQTLNWTNRDELSKGPWPDGIALTWNGALAGNAHEAVIAGLVGIDGEISGGFTCHERADRGNFTIPAAILERAGATLPRLTELYLTLASRVSSRIGIPGVDFAEFVWNTPAGTKTLDLR